MSSPKWLTFEMTPPKPSDPSSKLSPTSFLQATENKSPIRKRLGLKIDSPTRKKLRLDPLIQPEDQTILHYHQRLLSMPGIAEDRTKLLVKVPFDKTLDRISSLSKQMDSMLARIDSMAAEKDSMTARMDRMTVDIDSLTIFRMRSEDRELILHTANQTVLFINAVAMRTGKKLSSLESHGNSDQHAVSMRLSMAHTLWDEREWNKNVKLPHKYHDMIKDVSKVLKARNNVAHESTVQFAKLLSEPFFQDSHPGLYQYWTPVFRYIYRKSIEEIAGMEEEDVKRLFQCSPDPEDD